MNIETLKAIIIEGQEMLAEIDTVPRGLNVEANGRYVFVGIRQAGKSYMLYIRAKELIAEGHDPREMLFVNFDDERLLGCTATDLDLILQAYRALYPDKPILFLDEIQNVEGWEHFARRLANQKYMVYITGSNARMLSRDIATVLGARYIEEFVFPYSFREFICANGVELSPLSLTGKGKGEFDRLLNTYFQWGGFPESLLFVNKRKWMNELYEKILLGDIVKRNGVRNLEALRLCLRRLAENIRNPISYNRLANIVKGAGVSTNVASISEYIGFCQDACMIFHLENYASKFVERVTVRKHYFMDNGLLNIFLTDSETSLLENLCAVTLYRRSIADERERVYFYNKEVALDFYQPEYKRGIQASFSVNDPVTLERELKALTTFNTLYGLDEALIVTFSEDGEMEAEGLRVRIVPLAKWLLEM